MKSPVDESKNSIAQNAAIAIAKQKSGKYDEDGKRTKPYADGRPAKAHKFKKWNEEVSLDEHDGLTKDERLAAHRRLKRQHSSQGDERLAKMYDRKIKKDLGEDLRKWFSDKWVRMDTKGEIKGPCAREPGEGKPKCLPASKAHAMDKQDRATAARRKRREDPVADRKGKGNKPVFVATEEVVNEANQPTNPSLWSRAKALAKQKFDVYPSAYANGWAAKWYKSKGGGWKSVNEGKSSMSDSINIKKFNEFVQEEYIEEGPKDAAGKDVFVKKIAKSAGVDYKAAGAIAAAAGRKRLGKANFQKRVEAGQKAAAKARAKGQKYTGEHK